jgi:hypothetical protein
MEQTAPTGLIAEVPAPTMNKSAALITTSSQGGSSDPFKTMTLLLNCILYSPSESSPPKATMPVNFSSQTHFGSSAVGPQPSMEVPLAH